MIEIYLLYEDEQGTTEPNKPLKKKKKIWGLNYFHQYKVKINKQTTIFPDNKSSWTYRFDAILF